MLCSKGSLLRLSLQSNSNLQVKANTSISTLYWSCCIRHYCRKPCEFLFHHLLICLNSAGLLASVRVSKRECLTALSAGTHLGSTTDRCAPPGVSTHVDQGNDIALHGPGTWRTDTHTAEHSRYRTSRRKYCGIV